MRLSALHVCALCREGRLVRCCLRTGATMCPWQALETALACPWLCKHSHLQGPPTILMGSRA